MNEKKKPSVKEIIQDLKSRKKAVNCCGSDGILEYMEILGFSCKGGKSDNHKIFTHKALNIETEGDFKSFSIDCGHKPNKPMKLPYVVDLIKLISTYESELTELMSKQT